MRGQVPLWGQRWEDDGWELVGREARLCQDRCQLMRGDSVEGQEGSLVKAFAGEGSLVETEGLG